MACGCLAKKLAHGAKALVRAALGVDRSPERIMEVRHAICRACDHRRLGVCRLCLCMTALKVQDLAETCPDRKW